MKTAKSIPLLVIWLTTAATLLPTRVIATKYAIKDTYWKPLCSTAQGLRKVPPVAYNTIANKIATESAYRKTSMQIAVYSAAKSDSAEKATLQSLATALSAEAANQRLEAQTAAMKAIQATQSSQELVGTIEGVMQLLQTTKHNSGFCLGDSSGNSDGTAEATSAGCNGKPAEFEGSTAAIPETVIGDTGYTVMPAASSGTTMGTSDSNCLLFEAGSTPTSNVFDNSNFPTLMAGLIKISGSNELTRDAQTIIKAPQGRDTATLLQLAYHEAKQIKQAALEPAVTDPVALIAAVATNGRLRAALEQSIQNGQIEKHDGKTAVQTAAQIMESNFKAENQMLTRLWTKIKEEKVNNVEDKEKPEIQIRELEDEGKLQATLAYYNTQTALRIASLEEQINKLKEESGKSAENTDDKVCNAIEDKTTCDNNKQCSYHNKVEDGSKKCKYNETKAKEKGVSVTQSQTGGTETATDKCKDKKKDECKAGCKWEGKTCKDYSFLVNNKFSLVWLLLL
uniref:Variant surface glycoprotein 1125.1658 n=1 Tax=Trypanosoma brucei TaxID=5691 RepID=A0A1J0R7S2_9TRYP|nr:variant surface glycoprotein 1125.1658 [Trypanosoma brucei]